MTFRPNCSDETRVKLTPFRGAGSWDHAINGVIDRVGELEELLREMYNEPPYPQTTEEEKAWEKTRAKVAIILGKMLEERR